MSNLTQRLARAATRAVATVRNAERSTGRTTRRPNPPAQVVPTGVQIEYSPDLDGAPDPGEVVWAWVPYEEDPTLGKDRPVVIVGRSGADLAVVPLTSRSRREHVPVGRGAWDGRGRPSYADVGRLIDVAPSAVRREGAVLERGRFDAVVEAVARSHEVRRG